MYDLQLGASDRWFCPTCRRYQTGTIKSLSLSSVPDIMVVQLKRFKQVMDYLWGSVSS